MKVFLLVEDIGKWQSRFKDMLRQSADDVIEACGTAESAATALSVRTFDAALVDLELEGGKAGEEGFTGIGVIERIRQSSMSTVIVAYSSHIKSGTASGMVDVEERCKTAGADKVFSRVEMSSLSVTELANILEQLRTVRRARVASARPMACEDDIRTAAAMEVIGEDTVQAIVQKLLPEMSNDRVKALQGGLSGAWLLRVHSVSKGGEGDLCNVVKISDRPDALLGEVRKSPVDGSYFDRHGVRASERKTIHVGRWEAFHEKELVGGVALAEFIKKRGVGGGVRKALRKVVSVCVLEPAKRSATTGNAMTSQERMTLNWHATLGLTEALQRIEAAKDVCTKEDRECARRMRVLVMDIARRRVSLFRSDERVLTSHGDLHCDNVFVSRGGEVTLLDFGSSAPWPRLIDGAALFADLVFCRLEQANGNDNAYGRIGAWERWAIRGMPFSSGKRGEAGGRIEVLRDELAEAVESGIDGVSEREWASACAFQCLRFLAFWNVTFPKRIVALRVLRRLCETNKIELRYGE